jgi:P-type Ca2+ transporter type 2C
VQPARSPADRTARPAGAAPPGLVPGADGLVWHTLDADQVLQAQQVDAQRGLGPAEVASRAQRFGPNKFAEAKTESRWRAFIRQYADPMQVVLLVAGVVSLYPVKELETGLVLIVLTLFNAVLGLRQEGKAAAAVAALQKMMIVKARVTRGGELEQIPAEQLVPGDVVSIEAGDIVPADGRLLRAATLEVAESALTGRACRSRRGPTRWRARARRWATGPTWST